MIAGLAQGLWPMENLLQPLRCDEGWVILSKWRRLGILHAEELHDHDTGNIARRPPTLGRKQLCS